MDYTIRDVVTAVAEHGPLTHDRLVVHLDPRLRTGVLHPDFNAALNYALGQDRLRWATCPQPHGNPYEHNVDSCLLEVA